MRIERQKDGRHAVMDSSGRVMGLHNSVWSAARQLHQYFGQGDDDADDNKNGQPKPNAPRTPTPSRTAGAQPIPKPSIPKP